MNAGTLLLPALLDEEVSALGEQMANQPNALTKSAGRIVSYLRALVGRLWPSNGWTAGERQAGSEPLVTGRRRPYDESTLRKRSRDLARRGATDIVARAVEASVEKVVASAGEKATAYTDMFDQVYSTKKPAHAGPIATLGKRMLAATFFGLTFVHVGVGAALAYFASWHKPASPLQDGLDALHAEARRAEWLSANTKLHVWDRGGSGKTTLRWALARRIPYLTMANGSTRWTRYRRRPRVHTRSKVPVFVKRDATMAKGSPKGATPEEVIFPAHPDKGRASRKALRYRTGTRLSSVEHREMDRVYKGRWPHNENAIKALVAMGFRRNVDRELTQTTSRGTDGRTARLEARENALRGKINALEPTTIPRLVQQGVRLLREKKAHARERAAIAAIPVTKGARMGTGAELFCKNLMLLTYNRLTSLLAQSPIEAVQKMTPARLVELLLGRRTQNLTTAEATILWVEPVLDATERALQEELARLMNEQALKLRRRPIHVRIGDPGEQTQAPEAAEQARGLRVLE